MRDSWSPETVGGISAQQCSAQGASRPPGELRLTGECASVQTREIGETAKSVKNVTRFSLWNLSSRQQCCSVENMQNALGCTL